MPENDTPTTPAASGTPTDASGGLSAAGDSAGAGVQNPAAERASREAAQYRTQLLAMQQELAAFKQKEQEALDADKTDAQKAAKRAETAENALAALDAKHKAAIIGYELRLAAMELNFLDPQDAKALINPADLDFDDNGAPKNAGKLLKALAENKPYLVKPADNAGKPPTPAIGATNTGRQAPAAGNQAAPAPAFDWRSPPSLSDRKTWGSDT